MTGVKNVLGSRVASQAGIKRKATTINCEFTHAPPCLEASGVILEMLIGPWNVIYLTAF